MQNMSRYTMMSCPAWARPAVCHRHIPAEKWTSFASASFKRQVAWTNVLWPNRCLLISHKGFFKVMVGFHACKCAKRGEQRAKPMLKPSGRPNLDTKLRKFSHHTLSISQLYQLKKMHFLASCDGRLHNVGPATDCLTKSRTGQGK